MCEACWQRNWQIGYDGSKQKEGCRRNSAWVRGIRVFAFSSSWFPWEAIYLTLSFLPAPLLRSRVLYLVCKFTMYNLANLSQLHSLFPRGLRICQQRAYPDARAGACILQEEDGSTAEMGLANSVVRIFRTIRLTHCKPCLSTVILSVEKRKAFVFLLFVLFFCFFVKICYNSSGE